MSMSIDGYTSELVNLYNSTTGNKTENDIQNTSKQDYDNSTEEELMEACKEFESYFTEQVFKALERMVPESEDNSSTSTIEYFKGNLYQEYAKNASQTNGLGLAQILYESMKRDYSTN